MIVSSCLPSPALGAPRRRTDVVVQELDGEALVYDPVSADTHRLNATAWFIWTHCNGTRGEESIAAALSESFEISAADARPHVADALRQLRQSGLLALEDMHHDDGRKC